MTADATELEQLALDLVSIPSVIGEEAAIAAYVQKWADSQDMHEVVRAGDNVAVQPAPFRDGVPRVMLLGHVDTVPPAGDNVARIEGDRIYGLGSSDMKCADALILHLLARAAKAPARFDLVGVLYASEEGPYDRSGMPEIVAAAPAFFEDVALAVAMEPTDNHVELGCMGTMHAWVHFDGQRAHSARPWEGRNAIHMAAPVLQRLANLPVRDVELDGLRFREVCSTTMVEYEGARNVIPGRFSLNVNLRFAPDRTREGAVEYLTTLVRDAAGANAEHVDVEVTDLCPSGRVCHDNQVLASLRESWRDAPPVRAKQAWTDVGRLSEMGIDAINLGPGSGAQAHQAGEYCLRENLEAARVALERWLW